MNTPPEDPNISGGLSTGSGFHPPVRFARWQFSGRILRRGFFALACFFTLVALFYTEENWRGKQAWEKCRRDLEAKGAKLDWEDYIPPPVPDEQNIFKAPKMQEWFVMKANSRTNSSELQAHFNAAWAGNWRRQSTNPVLVAELTVVSPGIDLDFKKADEVWRLGTSAAQSQARKLLEDAIGSSLPGASGQLLVARAGPIEPSRILLEAETTPSTEHIRGLFPDNIALPGESRLRVDAAGSNSFKVFLAPAGVVATDYLASTEPLEIDLDLIRKALGRPYARMGGDYQQPFTMPIPNFIVIRTVAQALAQRTQCYLLLGQSEPALRELSLVHIMSRLMEAKPSGKPILLVSAMIDVAVTGLYVEIVAHGLRLHAWRELELIALQQQLKEVNLLLPFAQSLQSSRASACRWVETRTSQLLDPIAAFGEPRPSFWKRIQTPEYWLLRWMPRGWVYQNMAAMTSRNAWLVEAVDLTNGLVSPRKTDATSRDMETTFGHFSPYRFLAARTIPNYLRASQTVARNQTMVNEAIIACALERYRLAHNEYPESLTALMPKFIGQLPRDIINGQPLKYRRTAADQFLLYSVGWNESDDGGIPVKTNADGDWVWDSQKP